MLYSSAGDGVELMPRARDPRKTWVGNMITICADYEKARLARDGCRELSSLQDPQSQDWGKANEVQ